MTKPKKHPKLRKKLKKKLFKEKYEKASSTVKAFDTIVNEQREKYHFGTEKGMHLDMHAIREGFIEGVKKEEKQTKKGFFGFSLFAGKKINEKEKALADWEKKTAENIIKSASKSEKRIGKKIKTGKKALKKIQKNLSKGKKIITIEPEAICKNKSGFFRQEKINPVPIKQKNSLMDVFRKIFGLVKKISRPIVDERPLLPEKSTITTIYDSIYAELKQKKIVEVKYLSKKYNMEVEQLISLARNFEETGKIEIIYPIFGSPKLALKETGEFFDETA
jgi:hypothetical protein